MCRCCCCGPEFTDAGAHTLQPLHCSWLSHRSFMADEFNNGKNLLSGEYILPSGEADTGLREGPSPCFGACMVVRPHLTIHLKSHESIMCTCVYHMPLQAQP